MRRLMTSIVGRAVKTNFLLYSHPHARLLALQGAAFTVLVIIFSALSLKVDGYVISLSWVPLAAVFLWPRWSHSYLTPILIAILGVIADLLHGQFLGLSSLVYLIFFWVVKPTQRESRLGVWHAWTEFALIATLVLYISMFVIGRVLEAPIGTKSLMAQIGAMICFFPLLFALRAIIRQWLINPDDVNYQ